MVARIFWNCLWGIGRFCSVRYFAHCICISAIFTKKQLIVLFCSRTGRAICCCSHWCSDTNHQHIFCSLLVERRSLREAALSTLYIRHTEIKISCFESAQLLQLQTLRERLWSLVDLCVLWLLGYLIYPCDLFLDLLLFCEWGFYKIRSENNWYVYPTPHRIILKYSTQCTTWWRFGNNHQQ